MEKGFVYKWTNIKNGKMYVGSHKGDINDGYIGSGVYFTHAYKKNPNDFTREILYVGEYYRNYEDNFLKKNNCDTNSKYYNIKKTAIGGWEHVLNKDILIKRGKSISKAKKGITPLNAFRDKNGDKNPMYNKSHSDKARKIMSEKAKKRDYSFKNKKVILLPDNILFNTVNEVAEYYNLTQSTISHHINNGLIKRGKLKNKELKFYKECAL